MDLVSDLARGMPIVGDIPSARGVFVSRPLAAETSTDALMRGAVKWREKLFSSIRPSGDADADAALTRKTYEEVARGNLKGPFNDVEMQARVGRLYVPARRFVVRQGYETFSASTDHPSAEAQQRRLAKYRCIDDLSEPGINFAAAIPCKIDSHGLDVVVSIAVAWARAIDVERMRVRVELSDGTVLEGPIHYTWRPEMLALLLALEDLVKAYRQIAVRPSQLWANAVALWHHTKLVLELFE